jgi:sugar phosphate isomerase/epimerase
MELSLSVRVAEKFSDKRQANMTLEELVNLAVAHGYSALCMRASQIAVDSPAEQVEAARQLLDAQNVKVSMITGDFAIPENSNAGPGALRQISPYLDLAERLGAPLLRVCLKNADDIPWAQRAADQAAERDLKIVHQCHTRSLFERIDESLDVLQRIDRTNFGLVYEPANLELCGQSYGLDAIIRLAPHIFNVYLQNQLLTAGGKDTLETWCRGPVCFEQIPLWQDGGVDFPAIFSALQQIDYDGYITVHQASAELGTQAAVAQSAAYLRNLIPI